METQEGRILVIGARGQIGSELVPALAQKYGEENIVASDKKPAREGFPPSIPYEIFDATNKTAMQAVVKEYGITTIYHLASILSGFAEQKPDKAERTNNVSLLRVLQIARDSKVHEGKPIRVFWPSSIAAFGPETPKDSTPQFAPQYPTKLYGVTKVNGENMIRYWWEKWGVDTRSVRYPGLISWKVPPGGGTTDYAVDIFWKALESGTFSCFLKPDARLPMMHMDDAIRGTIELMEAPLSQIQHISYNMAAISFTPAELVAEIQKRIPGFTCDYAPDYHQGIADTWPRSMDDSMARSDWGWKHEYDLPRMVEDMLKNIKKQIDAKEQMRSKMLDTSSAFAPGRRERQQKADSTTIANGKSKLPL